MCFQKATLGVYSRFSSDLWHHGKGGAWGGCDDVTKKTCLGDGVAVGAGYYAGLGSVLVEFHNIIFSVSHIYLLLAVGEVNLMLDLRS